MKVKVFSTPSCPWCNLTKQYLRENNIEFQDLNVAEDLKAREEMVEKSGQLGVPVILIDDNVVIGFDKPKIKELLKL